MNEIIDRGGGSGISPQSLTRGKDYTVGYIPFKGVLAGNDALKDLISRCRAVDVNFDGLVVLLMRIHK